MHRSNEIPRYDHPSIRVHLDWQFNIFFCVCVSFPGFHNKATRIQQRLVARFPDEIDLQNQLAIGFLLANQPESARTVLEQTLGRWPDSGFAQVHLGFILKTTYNDNEAGVELMKKGIASREEGVIDGRFYFHLGDGLNRLGRQQEAQQVVSRPLLVL